MASSSSASSSTKQHTMKPSADTFNPPVPKPLTKQDFLPFLYALLCTLAIVYIQASHGPNAAYFVGSKGSVARAGSMRPPVRIQMHEAAYANLNGRGKSAESVARQVQDSFDMNLTYTPLESEEQGSVEQAQASMIEVCDA